MQIKTISQKIFRTKSSDNVETNCSNQTNPFGVSYKNRMINADVFFCGKEKIAEGVGKRISNHVNKLSDAWKVGAMGSFSKISNRFNNLSNIAREKAVQLRNSLTERTNRISELVVGRDSVKAIKKQEMPAIRELFQNLVSETISLNKEAAHA